MIDDLPEPSPIEDILVDLIEAENRADFAAKRGLEYSDGSVQVEIELEPDGGRPEEYFEEVTSESGRSIVAFVKISDLIDLATDDSVRMVRMPPEPAPHS